MRSWPDQLGRVLEPEREANAAIVAKYQYDPYGNIIAQSGSYAGENPLRYSTKYYDVETGLSYFGLRYYQPGLGRWLSRDPIGELGGDNLYAYVGNDPADRIDALGESICIGGWQACPRGQRPRHCPGRPRWEHPPYPDRDGYPPPPTLPPPVPECPGGAPECVIACGLGDAEAAAVCTKPPGQKPYGCTCDCPEVMRAAGVPREESSEGNATSRALGKRCRRKEEEHHVRHDLDCDQYPDGPINKPGHSQCPADTAHIKCLKDALKECGPDKTCRDALRKQAEGQGAQCVRYGPNDTSNSDGYNMRCTSDQRQDCLNALGDFLIEYGPDKSIVRYHSVRVPRRPGAP